MTKRNGAPSACFCRRKCTLAGHNRARSAGSRRHYSAVRICYKRRRNPWALNRAIFCCVTRKAGNRYTSDLRNKRRYSRQCWRLTGRVCRTAVDLSFAGPEGTWLALVRVSAPVVGSSKAHSRSCSGGRRGGRGCETSLVARRA